MAQRNSLPARPNLEHLKKQAKQRLLQLRAADPDATLAQAQLQIARDYGFGSWRTLHASIRAQSDDELTKLSRVFKTFAEVECAGRSPLYQRLSHAISDDSDLLKLASTSRVPIPNLFLAAVHYLLLRDPSQALARCYPSIHPADSKEIDAKLFRQFCLAHADAIRNLIQTRRVQTNEVARSGYLLPAFALASQRAKGRPLALIEIGAAAGLNLCFDQYAFDYGKPFGVRGNRASTLKIAIELRGSVPPPIPDAPPAIAQRIGIDVDPIDLNDPDGIAWLEALIWPEHHDRREQLRSAIRVARTVPIQMVKGPATTLLAGIVNAIPADQVPCIFQTHSLNQFTPEARAKLMKTIDQLGSRREMFFISRDNRLVMDHYGGGEKDVMLLADCDAHGRWIEWKAQPDPVLDPQKMARRALQKRERNWAESIAIIERESEEVGDEPRWESTNLLSPTLTEREVDAHIRQLNQPGQYRIISFWHSVRIHNGRRLFGAAPPTRSLQFLRGGDASTPPRGGNWRRVLFPVTRSRTDPAVDLAAALEYLRDRAPDGGYCVITVRRMLRAERAGEKLRIVKKHALGADWACLMPVT